MFRLFQAGMTPIEIARKCEVGTAGVEPFKAPRRTVHDIVTSMAAEASGKAPTTLQDAEEESLRHFPARVQRILGAELDRQERKQRAGRSLTTDDFDRLEKVEKLTHRMHLRNRRREYETAASPTRARKSEKPTESALDRLVRKYSSDSSDA